MEKALIGVTLLAVFAFCASAQITPKPEQKPPTPPTVNPLPEMVSPCPKLEVRTPTPQYVRDGTPVKFTASLSGGDSKVAPMFNWSLSAGVVISGQGTATIEIDSTGASADKAITVSVQVGGLAPECVANATETVSVAGPAKKLDEFGALAEDKERERLDAFMSNVTEKEQAYIFVYAGRNNPRGQANIDLKRIRAYLLKAGSPSQRLVTIDGGYRQEISHELWIVPIGAESPRSSPTVSPKDVVFPKTTPMVKKP